MSKISTANFETGTKIVKSEDLEELTISIFHSFYESSKTLECFKVFEDYKEALIVDKFVDDVFNLSLISEHRNILKYIYIAPVEIFGMVSLVSSLNENDVNSQVVNYLSVFKNINLNKVMNNRKILENSYYSFKSVSNKKSFGISFIDDKSKDYKSLFSFVDIIKTIIDNINDYKLRKYVLSIFKYNYSLFLNSYVYKFYEFNQSNKKSVDYAFLQKQLFKKNKMNFFESIYLSFKYSSFTKLYNERFRERKECFEYVRKGDDLSVVSKKS